MAALLIIGIGIGRRIERGAPAGTQSPVPTVATAPAQPSGSADSTAAIAVRPAVNDTPGTTAAEATGVPATLASHADRRPSSALSAAGNAAYDVALGQHLGQSEAFLTLFRSSVRSGRVDPVAFATARQLLSTNRLLLDSRAGADPRSRHLLQDLELVLAQIAQLKTAADSGDVHIVTEDMDQGDVLPRLRTAVPAGICNFTIA